MAAERRQESKQSVLFSLQEKHRPECNGRVSLGEPALVSHMKDKKHEEYVKSLQSNEKNTKISNFLALQQAQRWHNQLEIVESKQQKHRKWPLELAPQSKHRMVSSLFLAEMQH